MKICILGAVNIKHMTLISHYLDNIDSSKHDVDIIYVDKYGIDEDIEVVNKYKYSIKIDPNWSKLKKIKNYYKFKPFAEAIIKKNKYDLVIVWGTYTGHLFKNFLIRNYKERYILNIRDYFHENNKLIFNRMKKLINNSLLTTLSSEGFLKFLPDSEKYQVIYSFNEKILKNCNNKNDIRYEKPIRISFIGNNRFYDVNKKFMLSLKNDNRFLLQYFGTGSDVLKKFAVENNINNTKFIDGFPIEKTSELLNETDVLNNVYGNNEIALDTALSIRLYYAIYLNKPILTSANTFTSKKAEELGLGKDINVYDGELLGDMIEDWYFNLDLIKIEALTNKELIRISNANNDFYIKLRKVLENEAI
ncbi:glycosyltransferase [Mammaliicoccus sp. Dog046]|uniref:glycosyltransferase n=1 Tax=Mammaliicoccus sp. Dog046 TaxID=3034233 RepID=UPI002B25D89E|nr:glycosyltransferase [Mammaliicoccus sp. Dog046]WQK85149.1 glycosyltransferase [Mammaliicoccus sp. Dog046]